MASPVFPFTRSPSPSERRRGPASGCLRISSRDDVFFPICVASSCRFLAVSAAQPTSLVSGREEKSDQAGEEENSTLFSCSTDLSTDLQASRLWPSTLTLTSTASTSRPPTRPSVWAPPSPRSPTCPSPRSSPPSRRPARRPCTRAMASSARTASSWRSSRPAR